MIKSLLPFQIFWAVFREKKRGIMYYLGHLSLPFMLIFCQFLSTKMAEDKSRDQTSKNPCTYANPLGNHCGYLMKDVCSYPGRGCVDINTLSV